MLAVLKLFNFSVCSDVGTLMSSDRNYQEDSGTSEGTSLSTIDIEGKTIIPTYCVDLYPFSILHMQTLISI